MGRYDGNAGDGDRPGRGQKDEDDRPVYSPLPKREVYKEPAKKENKKDDKKEDPKEDTKRRPPYPR